MMKGSLGGLAGTRSGAAWRRAPRIQQVMRLMVEVRQPVGAGSRGLTRVPSGRLKSSGRKQPPLLGMRPSGSVTARRAKQAAAYGPDGMQLNGPRTCGEVPVKSHVMVSASIVTAT